MAVLVPTEGYCQEADVGLLTGRKYDGESSPAIDDVKAHVLSSTGFLNARLMALGIDPTTDGNDTLYAALSPIAARWAAGQILTSQGDQERGELLFKESLRLLDTIERGSLDRRSGVAPLSVRDDSPLGPQAFEPNDIY